MDIEQLKDTIREAFPDSEGRWWPRLGFIIAEFGHAYINVVKEELRRILPESASDVLKYLIGIPLLAFLWGVSGSFVWMIVSGLWKQVTGALL